MEFFISMGSREEILKGILKDIMEWNNIGEQKWAIETLPAFLPNYFHNIANCVCDLEEEEFIDPVKQMELEQWLLAMSAEEMNNYAVHDFSSHPVLLMNNLYERYTGERIDQFLANDQMAIEICKEIIWSKCNERRKMDFRIYGKDYKLPASGKEIRAYPSYGSLTEIQDIRIITKVNRVLERKKDNSVDIAVFGDLKTEQNFFKDYFAGKNISTFRFQYQQEDMFSSAEKSMDVNLKDLQHIKWLLEEFDLILFLDESYFYKKYRSHKSFEEETYAQYLKILDQRLCAENIENIPRINFYHAFYETARKLLAGKEKNMSPQYEFDETLIRAFEKTVSMIKEDVADVYFYIHNERMADKYIEYFNVCKEENYDGKNLNVYKVSGKKKKEEEKQTLSLYNDRKIILVDSWKLIKSISNNYYSKYWNDYKIRELMDTVILFRIAEREAGLDKQFKIQYTIKGNNQDLITKIEKYMQSISFIISQKDEIGCIKQYLVNMLSNAFLSRANSVECALMAYWVAHKKEIGFEYITIENWGGIEDDTMELPYRDRKQLYTIIEKLNLLMIRDMEQLELILFMEFKNSYAKGMEDESFKQCIRKIHSVCEQLGETDSRLYLCTGIN